MSAPSPERLYETDFYAWTQAQAKELRRLARLRPNAALDLAHIAEEIRDLGKSEKEVSSASRSGSSSTFCSSSIRRQSISASTGRTRSTASAAG